MSTILLAGFEKWGPYSSNPAASLVKSLDGESIGGFEVKGVTLPINFGLFRQQLEQAVTTYKPDIACGVGMDFKDHPHFNIELEARPIANYGNFKDETGRSAGTVKLDENSGILNVSNRAQLQELSKLEPEKIHTSTDAGAHMCETVLRDLISMSKGGSNFIPGFIHVPHTPDQIPESAGFALHKYSMPVVEQLKVMRTYLEVLAEMRRAQI